MISLAFSYRLGTSFLTHGIHLRVIIIFTYATVSSIRLLSKLLYPEIIFLSRKSRDPERRYYINFIIIKGSGMARSD
jgi:hypothetical protein